MDELVRQLREPPDSPYGVREDLMEEAANEIERLRKMGRDALALLSDGPGGPRRISAMKLISEELAKSRSAH